MLSRHFNKLISEYSEQVTLISNILKEICDSRIDDVDTLSMLQSNIIALGTDIESKYNLKDSLFIHTLEDISEKLYTIVNSGLSDNTLSSLRVLSSNLMDNLYKSIHVEDVRLSLVLIIKDEARYVREWIEFHNMLGVDHFYIYDNESSDHLKEILTPYIKSHIVTYHYWPGKIVQLPAYNHALENYRFDTEYMGFIDTDEFLFPIKGFSIPDTIDDIISTYHARTARVFNAGGIGVNWRSYGTSHISKYIEGLVIENYILRGTDDYRENVHIKTICKPDLVKAFVNSPHNVFYNDPLTTTISEHGSMIPSAFFYDGHCDILRINHYYTKSESELINKMTVRGWPDVPADTQKEYAKSLSNRLVEGNDIEDHIMDRFVEPLKSRMS